MIPESRCILPTTAKDNGTELLLESKKIHTNGDVISKWESTKNHANGPQYGFPMVKKHGWLPKFTTSTEKNYCRK